MLKFNYRVRRLFNLLEDFELNRLLSDESPLDSYNIEKKDILNNIINGEPIDNFIILNNKTDWRLKFLFDVFTKQSIYYIDLITKTITLQNGIDNIHFFHLLSNIEIKNLSEISIKNYREITLSGYEICQLTIVN